MTLALVDAFRNIARYDSGRSTFTAWLFGIAARKLHDVVRRRRRLKSVPPFAQVSFDGLREAADGHDLSAEAASRLDAQRQAAALAEVLSDLEFAVLALSAIEELSAREIGHAVGRSERAVHSLLHRARTKARGRLTNGR
jgi:RNA polymerase sigma factor (sigma-70 family)